MTDLAAFWMGLFFGVIIFRLLLFLLKAGVSPSVDEPAESVEASLLLYLELVSRVVLRKVAV